MARTATPMKAIGMCNRDHIRFVMKIILAIQSALMSALFAGMVNAATLCPESFTGHFENPEPIYAMYGPEMGTHLGNRYLMCDFGADITVVSGLVYKRTYRSSYFCDSYFGEDTDCTEYNSRSHGYSSSSNIVRLTDMPDPLDILLDDLKTKLYGPIRRWLSPGTREGGRPISTPASGVRGGLGIPGYIMGTASPAWIIDEAVQVPTDAKYLTFDIGFLALNANDRFFVSLGSEIIFSVNPFDYGLDYLYSVNVPIEDYAGGVFDISYVLLNGTSDYSEMYLTNMGFSAVPVPAAAWLFASGLVGLVSVSRKRRRC